MRTIIVVSILFFTTVLLSGCRDSNNGTSKPRSTNEIKYASGLEIYREAGYSIIKVTDPWPSSNKDFTYVFAHDLSDIPDSLKQFPAIKVPVKSIIVTSTTHIPSLEMLGVETSIKGFPTLRYISSEKVRNLIDKGRIRELGSNQNLNTEVVIDIAPDVLIGYGIDNSNPSLENLMKSGIKVVINGDWNEQTPLGKAEWLKLFGALYGMEEKADSIFSSIEKEYNQTLAIASKIKKRPSVIAGSSFENKWYMPQGDSWGAILIKHAGGRYLWNDTKGSGSISLPTELVLEQARDAEYWIGPGQFTSFDELLESSPHYNEFQSFQNKNVYTFSSKKGRTGGILYYELAPNRPDLVLKDILKILHPETLPDYKLYFFEKLK